MKNRNFLMYGFEFVVLGSAFAIGVFLGLGVIDISLSWWKNSKNETVKEIDIDRYVDEPLSVEVKDLTIYLDEVVIKAQIPIKDKDEQNQPPKALDCFGEMKENLIGGHNRNCKE